MFLLFSTHETEVRDQNKSLPRGSPLQSALNTYQHMSARRSENPGYTCDNQVNDEK